MILKFQEFITESEKKDKKITKSKSKKSTNCNECGQKIRECSCQDYGGGYLGPEMPSNLLY